MEKQELERLASFIVCEIHIEQAAAVIGHIFDCPACKLKMLGLFDNLKQDIPMLRFIDINSVFDKFKHEENKP